jgi:hypothetical protein
MFFLRLFFYFGVYRTVFLPYVLFYTQILTLMCNSQVNEIIVLNNTTYLIDWLPTISDIAYKPSSNY